MPGEITGKEEGAEEKEGRGNNVREKYRKLSGRGIFFEIFFREWLKYLLTLESWVIFSLSSPLFIIIPPKTRFVQRERKREREEIVIELRYLPSVTNIKSRFLSFRNLREETRKRRKGEEKEEEELMQIVQNLSRS